METKVCSCTQLHPTRHSPPLPPTHTSRTHTRSTLLLLHPWLSANPALWNGETITGVMRGTLALTAALLAVAGGRSSWAAAAPVDAGTLTTVTAAAQLYDSRLSASGGCSSSGCVAGLTRVSCSAHRYSTKEAVVAERLYPTDPRPLVSKLAIGILLRDVVESCSTVCFPAPLISVH